MLAGEAVWLCLDPAADVIVREPVFLSAPSAVLVWFPVAIIKYPEKNKVREKGLVRLAVSGYCPSRVG